MLDLLENRLEDAEERLKKAGRAFEDLANFLELFGVHFYQLYDLQGRRGLLHGTPGRRFTGILLDHVYHGRFLVGQFAALCGRLSGDRAHPD